MDGIKLDIKNDALKEIALLAIKQKTGARGLRSIIEKLLIDLMFYAPEKKDLEKIVINREVVLEKSEPLMIYSNKQTNQKILANKS
jgi:ATP-dependent Clp protease ATP-binding subunit ClpX